MTTKRMTAEEIALKVGARVPNMTVDAQWFHVDAEDQKHAPLLVRWVDEIRQKQATRYDNFRRLLSIYEWGYRYAATDNASGDCPINEDTLTHNAAQNIIDTVAAKVTKNEIVPMPLTVGGDMADREQAKRLGNALAGEFQENKIPDLHEDIVLDGLTQGASFAEVYREAGRVKVRKVPAEELAVEESDTLYRAPRTMGRKMRMDRYVALALYANPDDDGDDLVGTWEERARAILEAKPADLKGQTGYSGHNGQIDIYQGWHLPSEKPRKEDGEWVKNDGRKQIAINGFLLSDAPHNSEKFPIVKWCPRPRRRSYWGLSLMHALASGEREYEKLTIKIQHSHDRLGGTHVLARKQNLTVGELDGGQGTLIECEDINQVREWTPSPVSPATYQYQSDIPKVMQNTVGVSSMSTSSQIPAGLSQASGTALQVFDDFEAERLLPYHKESERWHIEIGERMIDEIRAILEESEEGSYKSRYKHQDWMDEIDWSEVLDEQTEYRLCIEAANNLAAKPAAKYEQATEMLQDGAIDIAEFRRMMGLPDVQGTLDIETADEDIILQNLRKMAVDGVYHEPQPFDDLQLYLKLAGKFFNLARLKGCPEKNLLLIMDAMEEVKRLLKIESAGAPPPPAPMAPPAGGVVGANAPMPALGAPPPGMQ